MYFDYVNKANIKSLINNIYPIYAHEKDEEDEPLEDHINLCTKYFFRIMNGKGLYSIFEKIEKEFFAGFSKEALNLYREMILNTIILHDMGKVNPYFQKERLRNNLYIKEADMYKNSHHSMLSSIIYMDNYYPEIKTFCGEERDTLLDLMMLNAYVISRHHGELTSFEQFEDKFNPDGEGEKLLDDQRGLFEHTYANQINISAVSILRIFSRMKKRESKLSKDILVFRYIYERFVLSILFACDFYATSEFMDGVEIKDIGVINDIDEFYEIYKQGNIYKLIRNYEKEDYKKQRDFSNITDINILRDELFLDSEKKLTGNIDSDIFYLEAPTGSGKSNAAVNLSFKLLEQDKGKNKIFYVYPFNTLVEQNIDIMEMIFERDRNILDKIAVINSIEPIKTDKKICENEEDKTEPEYIRYYKKALLNRQFLNYPMVLTTHVTIFSFLFGISKENIFPLYQLANSVIVLDEIQSYKNLIWGEIITFLTCYAKLLNIKFIIMSATLPNLDDLSLSMGSTVKLIEDRDKYFKNPVFKDRVKVDYSLMSSENMPDDLYNHIKEKSALNKKILVEFINKSSAYSFYSKLRADDISCEIELITGDDSIAERDRVLKKVRSSGHIILVATQVVEAGVDIDMDIGYKNISLFDSEEQFLGRINRSCKKPGCIVYFFNLDEAGAIYKGDVRNNKDITLRNETIRDILVEKDFGRYYGLVIDRLKSITGGINDLNINNFFNDVVGKLDFIKVDGRMKLISDDRKQISVYLSSNLVDKDGKEICGNNVWNEYKRLLSDENMDYAEKRVKLSRVRANMNNFIYEIKWNENFTYNDRIGELYFIEDGDKYFKDSKFDREKFISGIGDFI